MSKLSDEQFVNKVDWEGGLLQTTILNGLSADDLDDTTTPLYKAMVEFDEWRKTGLKLIEQVRLEMDKIHSK